jgi:uroporphyrinogen-III decarboxylase
VGYRTFLSSKDEARYELKNAYFPVTGCLWMPWSPHVVARPGHSLRETDLLEYTIEWENGLRLPLYLETASGNPAGYEQLMKNREEWPLWKEVLTPAPDRFDYTYLERMREKTNGEVALYGTITCPFGIITMLLGLEQAATMFFDDPEFARELMEHFTAASIEAGRDLLRHGVDVLRVGAASTTILGPRLFEQFVLPFDRKLAAALRETGGFTILHCCGHVNAMLESFARAGWDGLEPITPPPLGDTTLAEAKRRIGAAICLKGNLDPVHIMKDGDRDSVVRATRECLETGARGGGYILSVSDCMAPGTPRAHMEIVADLVHRFAAEH